MNTAHPARREPASGAGSERTRIGLQDRRRSLTRGLFPALPALVLPALTVLLLSGPSRAADDGYLIPDSGIAFLLPSAFLDLTLEQLVLARNEIFARKGYRFNDPGLQAYFDGKSWYEPREQIEPLNPVEKHNVELIRYLERRTAELGALVGDTGFESTLRVTSDSPEREVSVRACPNAECSVIGSLRDGCHIDSDMRLGDDEWVYLRSSACNGEAGPGDGFVPAAHCTDVTAG